MYVAGTDVRGGKQCRKSQNCWQSMSTYSWVVLVEEGSEGQQEKNVYKALTRKIFNKS